MRFSCWQSQLSPEPWRAECDRTWFWFPRKLGRGAKDLLSNVTMKIACIWDPNFTVWVSSMILVGSQRDGWGGWSGCCCYHWMRPSSVCVKPHPPSSGCRLGPPMGFSTRLVAQATHLQSPPLLFLLYFSLLTSLQAPLSPSLKPLLSTLLIFSLNLLWMLLHPSQWKFHLLNCADLKHRSILSFSPTPYPVHCQILITQQLQIVQNLTTHLHLHHRCLHPDTTSQARFFLSASSKLIFWLLFLSFYRASFFDLGPIDICVQIILC